MISSVMHIGMLTDKEHLGQLRIKMSKKMKNTR